jgi:dynein heavy chain, axonemal
MKVTLLDQFKCTLQDYKDEKRSKWLLSWPS